MANEGPGRDGHIARLLRTAREQAGQTQRGLANKLGIARSTIIKAEDGETLPNLDVLARLSGEFDVPLQVVATGYMRDGLRAVPDELARYEAELAENVGYSEALADVFGIDVERATLVAKLGANGSVDLEQRYENSRATRELHSLSHWALVGPDPASSKVTFGLEEAPATMSWSQEATFEGNERVNRVFFHEPWKPGGAVVTLIHRCSWGAFYETSREAYEKRAPRVFPAEKWPGKFRTYVRYRIRLLELRVELPEEIPVVWGPALGHWDKRPLDAMSEHALTTGRLCTDFELAFDGPSTAVLRVERPAPGFSFGVQWVPKEREGE